MGQEHPAINTTYMERKMSLYCRIVSVSFSSSALQSLIASSTRADMLKHKTSCKLAIKSLCVLITKRKTPCMANLHAALV